MARAYGSSAHLLMKRETVYGQAATGNYLACRSTAGSVIEVRTITKPVAGTVKVYLDGVEQLSGWSVDTATGLVIFGAAPALGVEVTADFEFDVPVRFDTDHMAVTIETYKPGFPDELNVC